MHSGNAYSDTSAARGISVAITQINCPFVIIDAGNQVVWANQDDNPHALHVKYGDNTQLADSGVLDIGDSFALNFPRTGTTHIHVQQTGK